jgi:uncharacterized flavoprotein (TIGR03862 family)
MPSHPDLSQKTVAVIGTGPAGLMAAFALARAGVRATLFEKRKSGGRKLLIAGSSGLNISYDCPPAELPTHYRAPGNISKKVFENLFSGFSREDWLKFINALGLETFKGTSRRYFVREMKASGLLKAWTEKLKELGATFEFGKEIVDFETSDKVSLRFANDPKEYSFDAAVFCLGGASWEPDETPLRWPTLFQNKNLKFTPFQASNTGFEVDWPEALLKEAEGKPLKSIELTTSKGKRKGELMVTNYGLEGTPIYAIGASETVHLDLKPDLSHKEILEKLSIPLKENLSPMRRVKKYLKLCEGSEAVLFHLTPASKRSDLKSVVANMKALPVRLKSPRPLQESISSSGGLQWDELTPSFMLKKFPQIYAAGEMLDWDAPTGGFLIQGCVSQGYCVGQNILKRLSELA